MARRPSSTCTARPDRRRTEDLAGQEPTPHRRDQLRLLQCPVSQYPERPQSRHPQRHRSGAERNFCRLGGYLSRAIASPTADG